MPENVSTLSGILLDCQEPEDKVIETNIASEDTPIMMFATNGKFGNALALIEQAVDNPDEVARIRTAIDKDGKIWLEIETKSGVHVMADALPLSVRFPETV